MVRQCRTVRCHVHVTIQSRSRSTKRRPTCSQAKTSSLSALYVSIAVMYGTPHECDVYIRVHTIGQGGMWEGSRMMICTAVRLKPEWKDDATALRIISKEMVGYEYRSNLYWSGLHFHRQRSTATHIFSRTCVTQRAPLAGTLTIRPEVVGWAPLGDLAPQSTSFGTVALRERQHLAMAATCPEGEAWAASRNWNHGTHFLWDPRAAPTFHSPSTPRHRAQCRTCQPPRSTFVLAEVVYGTVATRTVPLSTTAAMVASSIWRYGRMWVLVWVFIVCAQVCGLRHLAQRTPGIVLSSWLDTIRMSDSPQLLWHFVPLQIAVHYSPVVGCTGHCASLF